ncbi:MAG: hypothetical protein ABIQ40_13450 [Bacteroidia bacterium]
MNTETEKAPKQIRVFPLADPQDWVKHKDAIKKTILAAINPQLPGFLNVKYSFSIDPVSNWIRYNLENDLWSEKPKRSLPKSAFEATQAAKKFISDLQKQCLGKDYLKLEIPPVLPTESLAKIEHLATSPVFHFNKPWVDHWLCRFQIRIEAFPKSGIFNRIFDSCIDIRIGQNGKVVNIVSQWRPVWLNKKKQVEFIPFPEENEHSHAEDHDHDTSDQDDPKPELIYELDGENCPQNFLSPFHLILAGHHGGSWPASTHSIVTRMSFIEKETGGSYVLPVINGGSTDYTINWAYWCPDTLFDEGLIFLGDKKFIELSPGVYNLMMHVKDNKTTAVRLFENMAYVNGSLQTLNA